MRAKKHPVRALYEVEPKEAPRHTGLLEAIDALNAKVIRSDWVHQLIMEASAIDAPPPAVVLADEVRMWASYLRSSPDDTLAAFELGRAVERLNVQLHPKSQLGLIKVDADEVNRRSGKKGGAPRKHGPDEVGAFLLADAKHRTMRKLKRKFPKISERSAYRWLAEFKVGSCKKIACHNRR